MTNKEEEVAKLQHWCITILDYIINSDDKAQSLTVWKNIINQAADAKNLRGLRMAYSDINEMAKGITKTQLLELNVVLNEKFGEDLNLAKQKDLNKIKKLLKRATITNEEEYRLIMSYIDENMEKQDHRHTALIESLNALLVVYELKNIL